MKTQILRRPRCGRNAGSFLLLRSQPRTDLPDDLRFLPSRSGEVVTHDDLLNQV